MSRGFFVLMALLLSAVPDVQAAHSLTLANSAGGTSPQQVAANAFALEIERQLPGRFKIDARGGSARGGEVDLWEAVKLGTIDIAIITTTSIAPYVPQLGIIDIPFLFRDDAHANKVLEGPVGRDLGARIGESGVVFLGYIDRGFRQLTNSKRAIRSPVDLVGLKIRIIPNVIYQEAFNTLGTEAVPMPVPELYGALREGRVDGQENPLLVIEARRLDQVQKFLSLTSHTYSPAVIIVSADTYRGLKPPERTAFAVAARVAAKAARREVLDRERSTLAALKQKGMSVNENIDHDAFIAALKPLWPEWEKRFGANLLQRIRELY